MNYKADYIIIIGMIVFLLMSFCSLAFGANKYKTKSVSQSTSKENKIRKQNYDMCVMSGKNRSQCYYMYY